MNARIRLLTYFVANKQKNKSHEQRFEYREAESASGYY